MLVLYGSPPAPAVAAGVLLPVVFGREDTEEFSLVLSVEFPCLEAWPPLFGVVLELFLAAFSPPVLYRRALLEELCALLLLGTCKPAIRHRESSRG